MQFNTLFFTGIFLCIGSILNAQDLLLTSGKKSKTIKAGTYISVRLPALNQEPCDNCQKYLAGQLISFENKHLKLRVMESNEPVVEEKKNVGHSYKKYVQEATQPIRIIPNDSILSITKKGMKKLRSRTTGEVVGIVLTFYGMGHIMSAPVAELRENNSGGLFLVLGLSEMVAGAIIGTCLQQKPYITSADCPQKRINKKIWVLN